MKRSIADRQLSAPFLANLDRIIERHNRKAFDRRGRPTRDCSYSHRDGRRAMIKQAFGELARLGYRLPDPTALREKHLEALARHWGERKIAVGTLHIRFSALRVFAGWIGKAGLVKDIDDYYPERDMRRRIAATTNQAWSANGLDPDAVIEKARQLDERLALYLSLQKAFGLRIKEAIMMRPLRAITPDGQHLEVSDGTKGGRPRLVPIDSDERREVIAWAREMANRTRNHCLRWPGLNWEQAQARFYHLMEDLGLTRRQLGVTSHGLRHAYAQTSYRVLTGQPTPVEGGAVGRMNRKTHRDASLNVSKKLGHGRVDVVGFYYGSYGHSLRLSIPTVAGGANVVAN